MVTAANQCHGLKMFWHASDRSVMQKNFHRAPEREQAGACHRKRIERYEMRRTDQSHTKPQSTATDTRS